MEILRKIIKRVRVYVLREVRKYNEKEIDKLIELEREDMK